MPEKTGWTIGFIRSELEGRVQFWLIQDGHTNGGELWKWGTYISSQDAENHKDALKIAQDKYRQGESSHLQKKSGKAA